MEIGTKYQFIVDRNGRPRALEILLDAKNSLDTSVFPLNVIDSICLREHTVNLFNFFQKNPDSAEKTAELYLHLNVFPKTVLVEELFTDSFFVHLLKSLPFKGIVMEVMERGFEFSSMIFNENVMVEMFERLKNAGFLVAVDDFGSGFMSYNVLRYNELFDIVKIDYSVFSQDTEYLLSITQKLKALSKQVILEKKFLPEHPYVDFFQSYEVHYPKPIDRLREELFEWRIVNG